MKTPSDPYEDAALVYIRLIQQDSQQAADTVEQIHADYGAHAALRAALILTLLKMEVQRFELIPDIGMYTCLLKDSPEAVPLLKDAIMLSVESWDTPRIAKREWERRQQSSETQMTGLQNPFDVLLQRVRQHSPITSMKLEQIYKNHGFTAGCYAAFAVIWLEARDKKLDGVIRRELTDSEIQEFTYFQYMHEKVEALDQFVEMLEYYRLERQPANAGSPQGIPVHTI